MSLRRTSDHRHLDGFASQRNAFGDTHHNRPGRERPKEFGIGRPVVLTRSDKARLIQRAECLKRAKQESPKGLHITRAIVDVLRALLYASNDVKRHVVTPTLQELASRASCARSTVQRAIAALEDFGLIGWANRLRRVVELYRNALGTIKERLRPLRNSNTYWFQCCPKATDTDFGSTRINLELRYSTAKSSGQPRVVETPLLAALDRLRAGIKGSKS